MKHFILLLFFVPCSVFGQLNNLKGVLSTTLDKANNLYDLGFYNESIYYYEEWLEENPLHQQTIERQATSYMKIGDYKTAYTRYAVLFDLTAVRDVEIIKNYAEVSLSIGDLENATYWFKQAYEIDKKKVYASKLAGINNYDTFFKDSALVIISPIALNSQDSEFALRPFNGEISIVSSKNNDLLIHNNYLRKVESFTNLYTFNGINQLNDSSRSIIKLKNYLSSNDGPISQSKGLVAISRNNGKSKKEGQNTLGIFFYRFQEEELIVDSEFPFNNALYSNTHPWLNPSGDTLYYASNIKGNYGGFDIYYSVLSDSRWAVPVNAGAIINTSGNEVFPMKDKSKLYFTSNGHPGLGGLDNYYIDFSIDSTAIQNLGFPINSGYDDMAIYIESDSGFVSSNRPGGEGMDDIYQFKITPTPTAEIKLTVIDKISNAAIEGVEIKFKNEGDFRSFYTSIEGQVIETISPENIVFKIKKKGYERESTVAMIKNGDVFDKTIYLEPIIDLEVIAPDSIMFNLGKFELKHSAEKEMLQIKKSMDSYPALKLMIAAHTDSRGKASYNQTLSEKRAETTFDYLVSLGIDPERISKAGYGETKLLNHCKDGVKCTEKEHEANRRIEFFLSLEFEERTIKEDNSKKTSN